MKCPIMIMGRMASNDPTDISYTECLQKRCAWWNEVLEKCDPTGLLCNFITLLDKIPHEEQFRK